MQKLPLMVVTEVHSKAYTHSYPIQFRFQYFYNLILFSSVQFPKLCAVSITFSILLPFLIFYFLEDLQILGFQLYRAGFVMGGMQCSECF